MLDDVLAIPDHLRDALWRVESAGSSPPTRPGPGLRHGRLGDRRRPRRRSARRAAERPLLTVRGYELPAWTTPEWTALCFSYSGETEETLACFAAAGALGARRIAVSTGGALVEERARRDVPVIGLPGILPAPRTAVAYMFVAAAEVAALSGVAPRIHAEIEAAAAFLAREARRPPRPRRGGRRVARRHPAGLLGADLTAPGARRWKTQVNENAKPPAFFSELPEADHNELCGWAGAPPAPDSAVCSRTQTSTRARAAALRADRRGDRGRRRRSRRVETEGETRAERLLWAMMLGDLVSLELAEARGSTRSRSRRSSASRPRLGDPSLGYTRPCVGTRSSRRRSSR